MGVAAYRSFTMSFAGDCEDDDKDGDDDCPDEFRIFSFGTTATTKDDYSFDQESAMKVMAAAADYGNRLTIDYEHQALSDPPVRAPAAGNFKLEMRADGLYAVDIKWTPDAQKHLRDKEYLYYSPAFLSDDDGKPERLLNVALTNLPATKHMNALVAASIHVEETSMKTVLLALNLKDSASEAEALSAVTAMRVGTDDLVKLTGKPTVAEAAVVISAWKQSAAETEQLRADLTKLNAETLAREFDTVLSQATKDGKIPPAADDKRRVFALGLKSNANAVVLLRAYCDALPAVVGASAPAVEPKPADASAVVLTDDDKRIAKRMGVSLKDLAATKARHAAKRDQAADNDEDAA